jgi:FHA domain
MPDTLENRPSSPRDLKALIEAERTGMPFLHWRDRLGEQHILMLTAERTRVTIGRREQSDVSLAWDEQVSRAHALLEPVGEEWTLVDDGLSRNGSWVSGNRVHGRHRLHDGDNMTFGVTRVHYHGPTHGSVSTARAQGVSGRTHLSETQRKVLVALCRPVAESRSTTPATSPQIAAELFLSVEAVKAHLRKLFDQFGLSELPQNEKRSRLASTVLESGIIAPHDF